MTRAKIVPAFGVALAWMLLASDLSAQGYQVIVNAANPATAMRAAEVSRMFQKRVTRWASGQTVVPVDLAERSPVRMAFTQGVHRRSVDAIKAYWQRQVFSGRSVPPRELDSDGAVLAFVAGNINAIGYVSINTPLGGSVKALEVR